MYDYKSIGTTAAKVVSALAVAGGVLWWSRTPAPVDIPRPQDEAEIMHAILERHYAMGRTNTAFTKAYAANVSLVMTSGVPADAFAVTSSLTTNWGGTNYYIVRGETLYCAWTNGTRLVMPFLGGYGTAVLTNVIASENGDDLSANYAGWLFSSYGEFTTWYIAPAYTVANVYTGITYDVPDGGVITLTRIPRTDLLYLTNSPAHTDTNTIGFFPNASYRYPQSIRDALAGHPGEYADPSIDWITPSNTFMTTGTWDGDFSGATNTAIQLLKNDAFCWTNYVTLSNGVLHVTTNSAITNVITTDLPWQTNVTCTSQLYTVTSTNAVWDRKLFAFERDQTGLYWSTNTYNDMARALSLMQWIAIPDQSYNGDTNECKKIEYEDVGTWGTPPAGWSTTAYGKSPRATLFYYMHHNGVGVTSRGFVGYYINGRAVVDVAHVSGSTFALTNGYIYETVGIKREAYGGIMETYAGPFPTIADPPFTNGIMNCIGPKNFGSSGEWVTSNWITATSPTLPTAAWITNDFETTCAGWLADVPVEADHYKFYGWYIGTSYSGWEPLGTMSVTYRPVFQSLTNYTQHAPVR
jgi:hypothetical protein